jgi:hypothetical protein
MLRWVLLHNRYHIAVINRHFPTWVWVLHQLRHPGLLVPILVNSEDTTEKIFLAEVVVGVARLVVDISVVILLLCLRPRRLQKLPSRNAQLPDFNSQFLDLPVLPLQRIQIVQQQTTRTDKAKLKALEIISQLVLAYVAEAVDMVEVKAWLSVPMDEVAQLCVVVARSNSLCNLVLMPQQVDKAMICRDEVAPLDTIETLRATSRATGEINRLKASLNKINKAQWATSRASKADSNLVIAIVVR